MLPRLLLLCVSLASVIAQDSFPISTEEEKKIYDVIIVGGGLTGLSTARRIRENSPNASVLILEARGQVGGRVRARSMSTALGDEWVDLGSQFISRDHFALTNLAKELNIDLVPQTMCGERSVMIEGVRRKRQVSWSPALSVRPSFRDVIQSPEVQSLSGQSVAQFTKTTDQKSADAAAINRLLQTLYDAPENSISALNVALTAGSDNATVSELLLNNGHGMSFLVDGGMYKLVRALADGHEIQYSQQVVSIDQSSSPAVITTGTSSFEARQVVVTLPPAVAAQLTYTPPLDTQLHNFLEYYRPSGQAYYFTLVYPTAFWRAANKNGQIIYTSSTSKIAWLTTFDMTTNTQCVASMGVSGILWGIAHFADNSISEEQRHNLYIEIVARTMNTTQVPLDVKDVHFSTDPFALGSIGVMRPTEDISFLQYLKGVNTEGNIHFASAEFSNTSLGLMNGAVCAGQLAGDIVSPLVSGSSLSDGTRNDLQFVLFDAPLLDAAQTANSRIFRYSTSTHYPSTEGIQLLFEEDSTNSTPENSTTFPYKTSSHYPPEYLNPSTPEHPSQNVLQRDQPLSSSNPSSSFNYETSSHYPSTEAVETTTYTHFSMGNLGESSTEESNDNPYDMGDDVETPYTATNFVYSTSSQYPPSAAIETTTYKHFSMGNVDEPPAKMVLGPTADAQPSSSSSTDTAKTFNYRTSSHYPPSAPIETTTYTHFSMGNAGQHEPSKESSTSHGSAPSAQPIPAQNTAKSFEYRTSSHYPPSEAIETTTYKHFSMGNEDEPPAKMVLGPSHDNFPSASSPTAPNTSKTFEYRTSSHYPPSEAVETTTYKHFSMGNVEEPPAKMVLGPSHDNSPSPAPNTATTFEYRTSSHYPPSEAIETTTYKHFSLGNNDEPPTELVHALSQDNSPSPASNTAKSFEYRTSSHYPPSKAVETTTYKHFSMGNANDDEAPANMIANSLQFEEQRPIETASTISADTASTFDYRTSSHYPSTGPVETTTYIHFSMGNLDQANDVNNDAPAFPIVSPQRDAVPASQAAASPDTTAADTTAVDVPVAVAATVPPALVAELEEVVAQAPASTQLGLATKLTEMVQRLLQSLQQLTRR